MISSLLFLHINWKVPCRQLILCLQIEMSPSSFHSTTDPSWTNQAQLRISQRLRNKLLQLKDSWQHNADLLIRNFSQLQLKLGLLSHVQWAHPRKPHNFTSESNTSFYHSLTMSKGFSNTSTAGCIESEYCWITNQSANSPWQLLVKPTPLQLTSYSFKLEQQICLSLQRILKLDPSQNSSFNE